MLTFPFLLIFVFFNVFVLHISHSKKLYIAVATFSRFYGTYLSTDELYIIFVGDMVTALDSFQTRWKHVFVLIICNIILWMCEAFIALNFIGRNRYCVGARGSDHNDDNHSCYLAFPWFELLTDLQFYTANAHKNIPCICAAKAHKNFTLYTCRILGIKS